MMFDNQDETQTTSISEGTSAEYAHRLLLEKREMIAKLEYECGLLVDKYHSEIRCGAMPSFLNIGFLTDMFRNANGKNRQSRAFARKTFLELGFSKGFAEKHKVDFVNIAYHGFRTTAVGITLAIGDYEYTIEVPIPNHITDPKDKERLVGQVKFRVDRIHKSKAKDFVKEMETVQMPTYDWKKCFEAIEAVVAGTAVMKNAKESA
jgi:hypothetical protein